MGLKIVKRDLIIIGGIACIAVLMLASSYGYYLWINSQISCKLSEVEIKGIIKEFCAQPAIACMGQGEPIAQKHMRINPYWIFMAFAKDNIDGRNDVRHRPSDLVMLPYSQFNCLSNGYGLYGSETERAGVWVDCIGKEVGFYKKLYESKRTAVTRDEAEKTVAELMKTIKMPQDLFYRGAPALINMDALYRGNSMYFTGCQNTAEGCDWQMVWERRKNGIPYYTGNSHIVTYGKPFEYKLHSGNMVLVYDEEALVDEHEGVSIVISGETGKVLFYMKRYSEGEGKDKARVSESEAINIGNKVIDKLDFSDLPFDMKNDIKFDKAGLAFYRPEAYLPGLGEAFKKEHRLIWLLRYSRTTKQYPEDNLAHRVHFLVRIDADTGESLGVKLVYQNDVLLKPGEPGYVEEAQKEIGRK